MFEEESEERPETLKEWYDLRQGIDPVHVEAIDAASRYLEKRDYSLKVDWQSVWAWRARFNAN